MHIHILGICGTFMGGIAAIAKSAGHTVTGCDANVYPPMSTQLEAQGIELIEGFDPEQLSIGADLYVGTIDDTASGKLGPKGRVRLVGGGGGWSKSVDEKHFANDVGVFSTEVMTATGAEVGEAVAHAGPDARSQGDHARTPKSSATGRAGWWKRTGPSASAPTNWRTSGSSLLRSSSGVPWATTRPLARVD